ncbi:cupin domain-containing protein [Halomarina oriensis]|uniref:Cupin domain-containing protein n=1 Tax=Halomarina oriensis TaxID=671145 RepID=A0A6B0GWE5_9EURY|nr:cupin domain-containing protein [Halomarina oriensis]MWG36058.1 cupin domain-containing protein [Halomarina oriensis]
MEHVVVSEATGFETDSRQFRHLTSALGTTDLAVNYFAVAPGEPVGYCYHRHHDQEEVFYVRSGTATFDTERGDVVVDTNEAIRFAPGDWQQGWNRGDERLVVLALGAPREEGEVDLRRDCPDCGERTEAVPEHTEHVAVFTCGECGVETGRFG